MLDDAHLGKLRALVSAGLVNEAVAYLRSLGLSKGLTAIALSRVGMEPGAAKLAVHESPAWSDRHATDSAFHESLDRAVEDLRQSGAVQLTAAPDRKSPNDIVIEFDDPTGKEVTRVVREASELGAALRALQVEYPDLNFLVDIRAADRERLSVVLAGEEGMCILWGYAPLRTLGDETRTDEIPVWDGAGVEMPGREFIPLSALLPCIEDWLKRGHAAPSVRWVSELDVKQAILALLREHGPIGWYGIELRLRVPRIHFKDGYTLMTYLEEMISAGSVVRVAVDGKERFAVPGIPG